MSSLLRLVPYLRRHAGEMLFGMLAIVLSSICTVEAWELCRRALNEFTHASAVYRVASTYALLILGVSILGAVGQLFQRWLIIGASRKIEYEFRNDLFAHLQCLSPSFYDRHMTGDLMSRCTNDMDNVRMVLGPGIMMPVQTLFLVPIVFVQLIRISPLLTLVSLAPLTIAPVVMRFYGEMIHRMFRAVQDFYSVMSARVQENLAGIRVVKSLAREEQEIQIFSDMNQEYRRLSMRAMTAMSFFFPVMRLFTNFGLVAMIYVGATHAPGMRGIASGYFRPVTYGDLFAFFGLYFQLIFPLISIGWVINMLQGGAASMKRMAEILDAEPEIPPPGQVQYPAMATLISGDIEFRNLTFAYNGKTVLEDISLRIPAGRTIGLVGPVGSGKSTLLALIARLYHTQPGQLLIDGRDINEYPVEQLRAAIAMAPQETFLFSETIADNIRFGDDEADMPAIRKASAAAHLDSAIESFPHQYETELGERGINLSGGQKQRAAIARALLRDPEILLLDDCLSSVDTETEEAILRNLREVIRKRTAILVSHRISTVAMADEIIVLREGRIIERGTHDELLEQGGLYAELFSQQQLAAAIEQDTNGNGDAAKEAVAEPIDITNEQGLSRLQREEECPSETDTV